MTALRSLTREILDAFFVPICSECERRGEWVCKFCLPKVQPICLHACYRCGAVDLSDCQCTFLPDEIASVRSAFPFEGWVQNSIHRLKFRGERARAEMLASFLAGVMIAGERPDLLVPVPMHAKRLRRRGFNQAELLCANVSHETGIPWTRALTKTSDRGSQVGRNHDQRWLAVEGVFECTDRLSVRGRTVAIVDDVITTGATVSSCAVELRKAGAARVVAISIARG